METRLIGKIISRRFRVEDIIGRGGMAIVYRAFDLKTHQTVAVKVLREEYAEDPEYRSLAVVAFMPFACSGEK